MSSNNADHHKTFDDSFSSDVPPPKQATMNTLEFDKPMTMDSDPARLPSYSIRISSRDFKLL
jgi:hypothetical protein